jgi:small GTP-binding protein
MGSAFSALMDRFFKERESRLAMVGLDGAGKTTILYKLKLGDAVQSIPTIGFNCETIQFKNQKSIIWDIGGQDTLRPMWRHYYQNTEGIIFVVDSSDKKRIEISKSELWKLMANEDTQGLPVLIVANKQDIALMTTQEIIEHMELARVKDRAWHCQGSNAITGQGLVDGFTWLIKKIEAAPKKFHN